MFSTSPAKNKFRFSLLSIVFSDISDKGTPPAVTNSSLNCPFPVTSNEQAFSKEATENNVSLETEAHKISSATPMRLSKYFQHLLTRLNSGGLELTIFCLTNVFLWSRRTALTSSLCRSGVKSTISVP
uniref:Uncharacterized protein n=1 Tax=Opuntia streptacantha TaxID=393608 RepID=A0A7C9A3V4_OPUST